MATVVLRTTPLTVGRKARSNIEYSWRFAVKKPVIALMFCGALLAACSNDPDDADDRFEDAAEARAASAGPAVAALGLSEMQLLEADLIDASGADLGDVEDVLRNADGQVDRLLVEIEDSNPDRYVALPITGLKPVTRGDNTELTGPITKAQLAALPDATPELR